MTADPTPTPASSSSSSGRHPSGTVYLLHFDQRYEHAGHYTGWAEDLDRRLAEHLGGRAARLVEVITQAGIGFRLARTWPGVTRARERQLKRQGGASRYCPICQADRKARGLPRRSPRDHQGVVKPSNRNSDRPGRQWAGAVPTKGARPERVATFLELNPKFALPAGASPAKQWGRARGREEIELLTPRSPPLRSRKPAAHPASRGHHHPPRGPSPPAGPPARHRHPRRAHPRPRAGRPHPPAARCPPTTLAASGCWPATSPAGGA